MDRKDGSGDLTGPVESPLWTGGLGRIDPEIEALVVAEMERQRDHIELIASENFCWPGVMEATASAPLNKTAEGYPGRRYYGGCEIVDKIETVAIHRAQQLFGAEHANVQPHSGAQANMAVFLATLAPGDAILSLKLDHGGHLTHGLAANFSGKFYTVARYGVDETTGLIDFDEVRKVAKASRPKLVVCGGSAYPRSIDARRFREVADEVGALLLCDMAHFAGLVAAGLHPNPVPHCDFVTGTAQKTLAGARGGFILCTQEHATAVDRAVFPGVQGSVHLHAVAAKAVCFRVATTPEFRDYQRRVVENAVVLSDALQARGLQLLTGGTDTHLLQVDLRRSTWSGKSAEDRLHEVRIAVNRNSVPGDLRPPTVASGMRLGTSAATMRGFDASDFREVGAIIADALSEEVDLAELRARSERLCASRPLYGDFGGYARFDAGSA